MKDAAYLKKGAWDEDEATKANQRKEGHGEEGQMRLEKIYEATH